MDPTCSEALLSELSALVARHLGLHFPRERWGDLERGVPEIARAFGIHGIEALVRHLSVAPLTRRQVELLASCLTIGETYFFREKQSFEALQAHILPELLQARGAAGRHLRIWSAGCCTGEEPYSIAMLLDRLMPNHEAWEITILATDINPAFLRAAGKGVYGEWSFRDSPPWVRERYFKRTRNGRFEIKPQIRKMVTFAHLNLVDDVYPSYPHDTTAMDVIFCRNVLMYFTAEHAARVVRNLHRSIADGGWLIASPVETSNALFPQFAAVNFPGAVLYRKATHDGRLSAFEQWNPMREEQPETSPQPQVVAPRQPAVQDSFPPPELPRETNGAESQAPCRTARICANEGRLEEAAGWCAKAIAADKLNPAHFYLLATIQNEMASGGEAATSLERVLYLDPDFVLAHFALGNLRLSQGRRREARRHFENSLALLRAAPQDEIVPESEGLTAGRLGEIILAAQKSLSRARKEPLI